MCGFSYPHILVIDKFHLFAHFIDGSSSLAANPGTSIRQIPKKRPFGTPLMGAIKSGLMFTPGAAVLRDGYCFLITVLSSTISHFGIINYHQHLQSGG